MKINCFADVLFSEDWWQYDGVFSKRHRGARDSQTQPPQTKGINLNPWQEAWLLTVLTPEVLRSMQIK